MKGFLFSRSFDHQTSLPLSWLDWQTVFPHGLHERNHPCGRRNSSRWSIPDRIIEGRSYPPWPTRTVWIDHGSFAFKDFQNLRYRLSL